MIKASELRIGNRVYGGDPTRCMAKILTIIEHGVYVEYQLVGYGMAPNNPGCGFIRFEDLYPVPLTSEILEKCGFINTSIPANNSIELYHPKFPLIYQSGDWRWNIAPYLGSGKKFPVPNLKYCHQLQNLYFVLTGEELEIKA